jgi:hypothetical protein
LGFFRDFGGSIVLTNPTTGVDGFITGGVVCVLSIVGGVVSSKVMPLLMIKLTIAVL